MHALEALLRQFALPTHARWWIGDRPDVQPNRIVEAIAAQVALPAAAGLPVEDRLLRLSLDEAAHVLAVAGTTSLAYGDRAPQPGVTAMARRALEDLTGAVFLANGRWEGGSAAGWHPLTHATFDCGLIGYDRQIGFIFWVEEED